MYRQALLAAAALGAAGAQSTSRPKEETNTQCLLYQGNGCHAIRDETTCLNSRDGQIFDYLDGRDTRSQPCVWCGGEPCEPGGSNLCESYSWVVGNPSVRGPPPTWIGANCLDGRDVNESLARAIARPMPATTLTSAAFLPVDGGVDRACRGGVGDAGGNEFGHWTYSIWSAPTLKECMAYCTGTCTGVEYKQADRYCEVWWDYIIASELKPGYSCHKRRGVENVHPRAPPPGVSEIVAAGAVPMGRADADVGEWPAPREWTPAGEPGGRFVRGDGLGASGPQQVFWQDAFGKHSFPPGVGCAECGCDGENVHLLPQGDIDAMPVGGTFHCIAEEPPVPTAIPAGGRFVVVDEEIDGGGEGARVSRVLYWQNATGVLHLVPQSYDCSACGCDLPLRIPAATAHATPRGPTFDCAMAGGVQVGRSLLMPLTRSAGKDGAKNPKYQFTITAMMLLMTVGAVFAVCGHAVRSQRKAGKATATRGVIVSAEDSDSDAEAAHGEAPRAQLPARTAVAANASVPLLMQHCVPAAAPRAMFVVSSPRMAVSPRAMSPGPMYAQVSPPPMSPRQVYTPQATSRSAASSRSRLPGMEPAVAMPPPPTEPSVFDAIDQNHDGVVTRQEWERFVAAGERLS